MMQRQIYKLNCFYNKIKISVNNSNNCKNKSNRKNHKERLKVFNHQERKLKTPCKIHQYQSTQQEDNYLLKHQGINIKESIDDFIDYEIQCIIIHVNSIQICLKMQFNPIQSHGILLLIMVYMNFNTYFLHNHNFIFILYFKFLQDFVTKFMHHNNSSFLSSNSRKTQKSRDNNITSLYQPLRSTLQRISISPIRPVSPNQVRPVNSRVSTVLRELTPEKAEILKQSTFIPIDKRLVPTKNHSKIMGKKFQAVSVQQRYFNPINQQQMRIIASRLPNDQQTIYQFQQVKQAEAFPMYVPKSQYSIERNYQMRPERISFNHNVQQKSIIQPTIVMAAQQQTLNRTSSNKKFFPVSQCQTLPSQTPMKKQKCNNYESYYYSKNTAPQTFNIHPPIIKSNTSITSTTPRSVKKYNFKKNIDRSQSKKSKSIYKYNLFSMIDHAVNTKCQSCGGNEIIALKPKNKYN